MVRKPTTHCPVRITFIELVQRTVFSESTFCSFQAFSIQPHVSYIYLCYRASLSLITEG